MATAKLSRSSGEEWTKAYVYDDIKKEESTKVEFKTVEAAVEHIRWLEIDNKRLEKDLKAYKSEYEKYQKAYTQVMESYINPQSLTEALTNIYKAAEKPVPGLPKNDPIGFVKDFCNALWEIFPGKPDEPQSEP